MKKIHAVPLLRIKKLAHRAMWYDTTGCRFVPLLGWSRGDGFRSREPNGYLNFVHEYDAHVCIAFVPEEELGNWPYAKNRAKPANPKKVTHFGWRLASESRAKQIIEALETERINALPWLSQKTTAYAPHPSPPTSVTTPAAEKTGQSAKLSSYEATANMVLGFVISLGITAVVFPELPLLHNVGITSVFAVASWLRSYALRRIFNHHAVKGLS